MDGSTEGKRNGRIHGGEREWTDPWRELHEWIHGGKSGSVLGKGDVGKEQSYWIHGGKTERGSKETKAE